LTEPERNPTPKSTISEWELEDNAWVEGDQTKRYPKPETAAETPQTPEEKEWATKKQEEDWDLEKPPREPTIPALKRKIEESINLESLRNQPSRHSQRFEAYQRQKQQQRGRQNEQQIYDAQYRVIKPPQESPPPIAPDDEENEEEDWV
jgi:hypothetical protein